MYYQSPALILKTIDYRDSDQLIIMLTADRGKKKAVAKGVKKPASSLRAPLQTCCHSLVYVSCGRELDVITQARIIDFYPGLREDNRLAIAGIYIMEILDKSLPEGEPVAGLYRLACLVLGDLNENGYDDMILRYFEAKLLAALGFKPQLDECVLCGSKDRLFGFSAAAGGMVCVECGQVGKDKVMEISGETLGILRRLFSSPLVSVRRIKASNAARDDLYSLLDAYWRYHIEQPLTIKPLLKRLNHHL